MTNMNPRLCFVMSFLASLSWLGPISATTTTGCYNKGRVSLQETCKTTQYILIHSVESQEVSSCNGSSPGARWSRSGGAVNHVWQLCNLQKERCTTGIISKAHFLRMNYTCVNELSSIRRYNMCSNVSEVISTPVYLQSPGYPDYYSHTSATNCTCFISVSQTQTLSDSWLTLYDMFTLLPETLTLKWSNGTRKGLTTVSDNFTGYILNQETIYISSPLSVSFVPSFSGLGYFWIGLESRARLSILMTCNAGLRTSQTLPPTVPVSSTRSAISAKPTETSTYRKSTTAAPSATTLSEAGEADDQRKIISIVITIVVVIIVIAVVSVSVIIVKRRKHSSEDVYETPLPMSNYGP